MCAEHIEIAEATPIERTLDLNADVTLDMIKVFVAAPESSAELRNSLERLLGIHKKLVDLTQEQVSHYTQNRKSRLLIEIIWEGLKVAAAPTTPLTLKATIPMAVAPTTV